MDAGQLAGPPEGYLCALGWWRAGDASIAGVICWRRAPGAEAGLSAVASPPAGPRIPVAEAVARSAPSTATTD